MAKYLLFYLGGTGAPSSPEEGKKVMDAWMAWFGRAGSQIVDGGAPFGPRKTVGGSATSGAGGYSIITADNIDAAVKLTDGHPHLMGGGAIEVCETAPIPM